MIASLTGIIQFITSDRCILDVNGVGYEVFLSTAGLAKIPEIGEKHFLHIHTSVREDAIVLFGFSEPAEKEMFLTLKTVSGIGPKLALAVLSGMEVDTLAQAIGGEDVKALTTISGVGKKTAERICVELKEKVGNIVPTTISVAASSRSMVETNVVSDALSALVNLGYSEAIARDALARVKERAGEEAFLAMSIETLIKEGLGAVS